MTKLAGKLLERGEKEDENWINYEIEDLKIAIRFKFKKKNFNYEFGFYSLEKIRIQSLWF